MIRLPLLLITLTQSAIGVVGPLPSPTAPAGLEVQLRTAGNKTTFQLSEVVPVEVVFRTSRASTYSIEIADGWNSAAATDRFHVEPGHSVINRHTWGRVGTLCCNSRRAFLTSTPAVYGHELTDLLRFTEPGNYRIQYTTRRVFTGPLVRADDPSDMLLRSNIVTITITADDPRRLDEALPAALAGVEAPPLSELPKLPLPLPGSLERPTRSAAMLRYRRADRQLRLLDTPDAIRARVAVLRMPSVDQWRASEATGTSHTGMDGVAYSSRPDLVAAALHERAAAPDFGVMRGYFELWVKVLVERDHPALVRLPHSERIRWSDTDLQLERGLRQGLLDAVRELGRSKTGVAAEITNATLRQIEREMAKP